MLLPAVILAAYTTAMVALVCVAGWHPRRRAGTMAVMGEQACPGPCNRRWRDAMDGWRQAMAAYDPLDAAQSRPDTPATAPWPGEPVWCGACTARIRLRLAQLDTLAGLLAATADGHRQAPPDGHVTGTVGSPSPSQAADDLGEMYSMLTGWESAYRDWQGWDSGPPKGDLAARETETVTFLSRQLGGILASPMAADFGREILQWHQETAAAAKAGVRTLPKPLRCPGCGLLTLVWTEGEDRVDCANPGCGLIMSYREYESEVERVTA